jgi:hypothetical protein
LTGQWYPALAFGAIVVLGSGGFAIIRLFAGLDALGPWIAATLSIIAMGPANRIKFKSNKWRQINLFKPVTAEIEVGEQ